VRVGPGADIGAGATVGPDAVIGARATVAPGVRVAASVVWPDSAVTSDAEGAIVTPRQRITVAGFGGAGGVTAAGSDPAAGPRRP
jgi:UDP-3-O-[3-hydroxymyristoyl] glucosamine N-acyltransferase